MLLQNHQHVENRQTSFNHSMDEVRANISPSNALAVEMRIKPEIFHTSFTFWNMVSAWSFDQEAVETGVFDSSLLFELNPRLHLFKHDF